MKKVLPLCLLLAVASLSLHAQNWQVYLEEINQAQGAFAVVEQDDGGFLIGGYRENPTDQTRDILLTKIDVFGQLLWSKVLVTNANPTVEEEVRAIAKAPDGNYLVLGRQYTNDNLTKNAIIYKVDPDGAIKWSKTYFESEQANAYDIAGLANNECVITGQINDQLYLTKIDDIGNILWHQVIAGGVASTGAGIIQTPDQGFAVTGIKGNQGSNGFESFIWVIKTDINGQMEWEQEYGEATYTSTGTDLCLSPTGDLVIAAKYYKPYANNNGGHRHYILKVDIDGNTVWQKYAGDTDDQHPGTTDRIAAVAGGGYVISGGVFSATGAGLDLSLIHVDEDGQQLCYNYFTSSPDAVFEEGYDVITTSDGDFLMVGYSQPSPALGAVGILAIKTSMDCNIVPTSTKAVLTQSKIELFPNPVSEFLNIRSDIALLQGQMYLTNAMGQKVFQSAFVGYQQQYDLSHLPNGMYFITLEDQGKFIYSDKLVVKH